LKFWRLFSRSRPILYFLSSRLILSKLGHKTKVVWSTVPLV